MNEFAMQELPQRLTASETRELLIKYKLQGSREAREKLIKHNLRLVIYMTGTFKANYAGYMEDLFMAGTLGLIKGIDSFKIEKGVQLATYVSRAIQNEALMLIRNLSKTKVISSYDDTFIINSKEGQQMPLLETIADDTYEPGKDKDLAKMGLTEAFSKLKPTEQLVINLRYGLNGNKEHTQQKVADILGYAQSYVSRVERKAIGKLRKELL